MCVGEYHRRVVDDQAAIMALGIDPDHERCLAHVMDASQPQNPPEIGTGCTALQLQVRDIAQVGHLADYVDLGAPEVTRDRQHQRAVLER